MQHFPLLLVLALVIFIAPEACKFIQEATRDIREHN